MRLLLSVFAQDLVGDEICNPFAVIAQIHPEPDKDPTVIGTTEVLRNTKNPDWTKLFILNDFNLGKPMHIIVTIRDEISCKSLGSAMFEVGSVLGTKGGILGKEIQAGGVILANVERASGSGTLNFKMRAIGLKSQQEQVDAFFELQRKKETVSGDIVWDTVFRSRPVINDENPIWDECCVELSALTGGKKKQKFRVAIKDYDENEDTHSLIGFFRVSPDLMVSMATGNADTTDLDEIGTDKTISVAKGKDRNETGHVVIISAGIVTSNDSGDGQIAEDDEEDAPADDTGRDIIAEDIAVEASGDIELVPDELVGGPCFADYISGGCQLRVITAIDYTSSNGDPRKEDSLHYLKSGEMNQYQKAISMICKILSEYDSDQKYPVWGFGAKKDGKLNQCFQCGKEQEVEGVEGILEAYMDAFKSGIAMSSPTDITQVIKAAGKNARESLAAGAKEGNQAYSILAIFTNGNVHSVPATIEALDSVNDDPLSIVVIGVGPSDFNDMSFFNERKSKNNRVRFVDMKSHQAEGSALTEETLKDIPQQLVNYFVGHGITPNPPIPADDIVIEPFKEEEKVEADVIVSESGDIKVVSDAKPPDATEAKPSKFDAIGRKAKEEFMKQGKRLFDRQKKQFGRVQKKMQQKMDKMIDQQIKEVFKM